MSDYTNAEYATGLRALADMIESTPEIPADYLEQMNVWYAKSPEILSTLTRAALRHGAKVDKNAFSEVFDLRLSFGPVTARCLANRDNVCERVVTGTETVTKTVPDPVALAAVPTVEVTEVVEISEWKCGSLLAAEKSAVTS
jgi:hypothetical protein